MNTITKNRRPILCGTDFSANAMEAVDVAAGLARRLETKLILLHVHALHRVAITDATLFEAALSEERVQLDREAGRLRKAGTIVEEKMRSGSAFDELVTAAIEAEARLIVLGAVGHGLARRLFIGSVAERTAGTSPIPTLVIRPGSRLGSWIQGKQPLRILTGYDFSPAGDAALHWVNELQQIGPCAINVVHIDWPPDEARRHGYHGPLPLSENPKEIQNVLERDLTEQVAMFLPPEKVTITVEPGWGRTEGYLFEMAHRQDADLVVIGTHRRHGLDRLRFGSVSRAVLHHATATVAVIPPAERHEQAPVRQFDRVMVATDFSEPGNKAVGYAAAMLRRGTLKLIHVVEPNGSSADQNKPTPNKENPKLRAKLRALIPRRIGERLEIETEIIGDGNVAKAITQAAVQFRADAICLGGSAKNPQARTSLASLIPEVLATSKCPVLIVPSDDE